MRASVRVTNNSHGNGSVDSHAAGRARLKLKLAAIAYVATRHGVDADVGLTRAGLLLLGQTALEYVAALTGTSITRTVDLSRLLDSRLQLAAIAYSTARHGIDADVGLSREGLALLCQAAVEFVEMFTGADPKKRPIDPTLQLGGA